MEDSNNDKSVSLTYQSTPESSIPPDLRILAYNDVYHIEAGSAEPVGGISRFQTVVNQYRSDPQYVDQPKLITLFSGDAFNPSLESSVTKGRHMVPILNNIGTDVAFPWLLANVLDPALGEDVPLANCTKTMMLESSNGIKIGLIGLAEREWLDTINSLPPNLIYRSASETAKQLVPDLRAQGAEIIIALTHAREPSDVKLAEKTPPGLIDIVLGGHDHFYAHQLINSTHILRSGTDFKQLSYIEARRKPQGTVGWDFTIIRRDIVRSIPEDPDTVKLVDKLTSSLKNKLEKPIGYTAVPLDGRFTTVRTRESNLGNFVCDLMRHFYNTDCALMAGGTIRGDQIYPPGVLLLKDILNCFPFEDPVVVLRVSGKAILSALENAVCLVPALEGRYPQVSNIQFCYNVRQAPGSRVSWVKIHHEPLDEEKQYVLATRGYMARGKDGFTSLLACSEEGEAEEIVSEENGILISMILRQYFMSLKVLGKWRRWGPSLHRHWDSVHKDLHADGKVREAGDLSKQQSVKHHRSGSVKEADATARMVDGRLVDSDTEDEDHDAEERSVTKKGSEEREMHVARWALRRWMDIVGIHRQRVGMVETHADELMPLWTKGIAPMLENRIIIEGQEDDGKGRSPQ